uniref:Calcineurin-like phosphoesterase domain-containing protein n=1 Tax=viral metagenome TaxID=1070528 RepID=A0A6C0L3D5_9ZZZZ
MGDMGDGSTNQFNVSKAIERKMNEKNDKNVFLIGLGDNIYDEGCVDSNDEQFVTKFEDPYKNISDKVKFYMCLGNHDYGNSYFGTDNSKSQIEYSQVSKKRGGKWILPSKYYTFRKGDVQLIVIDTNLDYLSPEEVKKQSQFIRNTIRKSKAKWKIVYGHHTWRSMGNHGNADNNLENFLTDIFMKTPFDIYMCGHDHSKQVIQTKINNKEIHLIVCGTGGAVCDEGKNYNMGNDSKLIFGSNNLGYGYCLAQKNSLSFEFLNDKNNLEFIYKIKK